MLDIQSFSGFDSAARAVLGFLQERIGFDLWMVTRTEGQDWIVLQASDHGYGVEEGDVFRWADSFCCQMVAGHGPRIAPCSDAILAYAIAPIGRQVQIGAYIGVPLTYSDGSLFGTLCAIHPSPQTEAITDNLDLVELLAKLLSTILNVDLYAAKQTRFAERAIAEAMSDALTSLYNRRGWENLLASEETRCQQLGYPACVILLDLDGLKQVNDAQGHANGDELLKQTAQALLSAVRRQDVVARLGGDEFAILAVECDRAAGSLLMERIQTSLMAVQVKASLGIAQRDPSSGLFQAWVEADQAMYVCKRSHSKV
ncbi:sensor domain-containing diguanylate cyclase [Phormidium sp. CLA17]|uniref:sensor domain-containing diguanylate cyclase n=1 Tax=Leptolyngbya sp. Cla-17 TaxID=2803751 RepID=UPI001491BC2C|nr:sensor domain-containing diguanylate cyclase [Leptolyngbya sp. Cla-17]MBM0743292.1 sensor domain-containing diguanylate cyclase [Leptolyngbya sp. Cla-17]